MADRTIGELTRATQIQAQDLFVLEQSGTAKSMTGQTFTNWLTAYADGHGGVQDFELVSTSGRNKTYQFTMADETTFQFVVTDGAKGDTGAQTYVHIKWAAQEPTADNQLSDNPDAWIGIYVGLLSTAPTTRNSYAWYEYKGEKGDTGNSIDSISLVEEGGPGEYNVYSVELESGDSAGTFRVRNGLNGQGSPSDSNPLMDGTAAPGLSVDFSRADHVHPSDTSRAEASTHNLQTYTLVTQLGLTQGSATLAGAYSAMPNKSMLIADAGQFLSTELPSTTGAVEIFKATSSGSRGWIYYHEKTGEDYRMGLNASNLPDGTWVKTTKVDFSALCTFPKGAPAHFFAFAMGGLAYIYYQGPAASDYAPQDVLVQVPQNYRFDVETFEQVHAVCTFNVSDIGVIMMTNSRDIAISAKGTTSGNVRAYFQLIYPIAP